MVVVRATRYSAALYFLGEKLTPYEKSYNWGYKIGEGIAWLIAPIIARIILAVPPWRKKALRWIVDDVERKNVNRRINI